MLTLNFSTPHFAHRLFFIDKLLESLDITYNLSIPHDTCTHTLREKQKEHVCFGTYTRTKILVYASAGGVRATSRKKETYGKLITRTPCAGLRNLYTMIHHCIRENAGQTAVCSTEGHLPRTYSRNQ